MEETKNKNSHSKNRLLIILFILSPIIAAVTFLAVTYLMADQSDPAPPEDINEAGNEEKEDNFIISGEVPEFEEEEILSGLNKPWDMVMLDDGTFIFTERANKISYFDGTNTTLIASPEDTYVNGEGGMLSLALDSEFETNSYIYACFNSNKDGSPDVRVVRFEFNQIDLSLENRTDLVTGIPSNASGRHSGCQLEFGPDGYLWIGTGDAAQATHPQDPNSLGGKILRIDRNGEPVEGNLEEEFDPRIFNYGHRNVQGLGFFDPEAGFDSIGISIEQGSRIDDEVNSLLSGNLGWDPIEPYIEDGVPMTNLTKYPNAIESIWSSGSSTEATSGGTIIQGEQWEAWNQAVAVGVQKNQKVIILEVNKDMTLKNETEILVGKYGRIRTVTMGTDGALYLLTDNGSNQDRIIKLFIK